MNLISILIGLFALAWALLAFLPLFGWMYWLILPVALAGLGAGLLSSRHGGRNLNLLVILVGAIRLAIEPDRRQGWARHRRATGDPAARPA